MIVDNLYINNDRIECVEVINESPQRDYIMINVFVDYNDEPYRFPIHITKHALEAYYPEFKKQFNFDVISEKDFDEERKFLFDNFDEYLFWGEYLAERIFRYAEHIILNDFEEYKEEPHEVLMKRRSLNQTIADVMFSIFSIKKETVNTSGWTKISDVRNNDN